MVEYQEDHLSSIECWYFLLIQNRKIYFDYSAILVDYLWILSILQHLHTYHMTHFHMHHILNFDCYQMKQQLMAIHH